MTATVYYKNGQKDRNVTVDFMDNGWLHVEKSCSSKYYPPQMIDRVTGGTSDD